MKPQIEKATAVLVGKALWGCTRAADLASFAFGERREAPSSGGGARPVGEFALHVQCAWRITRGDQVLVGSRDLYYPASYGDENREIPPDFDWDGPQPPRQVARSALREWQEGVCGGGRRGRRSR